MKKDYSWVWALFVIVTISYLCGGNSEPVKKQEPISTPTRDVDLMYVDPCAFVSSCETPEPDDSYFDYLEEQDQMTNYGNCVIKGNISFETGEKIYHVPGQKYYSQTVIDTSIGERWFCSEEEARAAGWRKSNK